MDLILWRHAEAAPGEPDETRALTDKGQRQARKMAAWLNRHLPHNCRILASPAIRTMQTAQALGRKFDTHAALFTDSTPENILAAVDWPHRTEPVLVIGHQPTLGQLAALMMSGKPQNWTIRKGSIFWIAQKPANEGGASYIKLVLEPELIDNRPSHFHMDH